LDEDVVVGLLLEKVLELEKILDDVVDVVTLVVVLKFDSE
jgi:hypothetical protein